MSDIAECSESSHTRHIEPFLIRFDGGVMKWVWIYLTLFISLLLTGIFLIASIILQTHYLIALSSGLVIIALVAILSCHIFHREDFFLLACGIETDMRKIAIERMKGDLSKAAEELLKYGTLVKKRWHYLIILPKTSWLKRLLLFPKHILASQFFWIPYYLLAEILFHSAKTCYITSLRKHPKDLAIHTGLANTYVTLATHLKESFSMKEHLLMLGKWIPKQFFVRLERRYDEVSLRAIQELSILRGFRPNELWILDQLAISYRELKMEQDEIEIYNSILAIDPEETTALFRLGLLSFQRGDNVRGLEIYDQLLYLQPALAQEVIHSFGAYDEVLENFNFK